MSSTRLFRALLPTAVTVGSFYAISRRIDWLDVLPHLRVDTFLVLGPALIVWASVSLCIDALCLAHSVSERRMASFAAMARLKAATYPLGIIHYAFGVGALVVLLRRRAGLSIGDATGVVTLISALDLVALLLIVTVAGDSIGVRMSVVAIGLVGAPLGLWLVRTERNLGVLDAVRRVSVLRAAR